MLLRALILRRIKVNYNRVLEYDKILEMLAGNALSQAAKARCLALAPSLDEAEVRRWMDETTQAKRIILEAGTPPLSTMEELQKVLELAALEAMLVPDQIARVLAFLVTCRRMKAYLKKAETTNAPIAAYGGSLDELRALGDEIERCIVNGLVDDRASAHLNGLRRQMAAVADQIREKLNTLLRKNKAWFSESFVSVRNGRYTLPVKREHKNDVSGTLVEMSNTGGTCFIEPASVGRLQTELHTLQVEEDSEVRRILYELTALISDQLAALRLNIEAMETLDFLFAKGKFSLAMKASPVGISTGRSLVIKNAVHPLLDQETAVPLCFEAGLRFNGVIITGPNTGGKTVALKTVGLLSLMVQCGLHVPADAESSFCMRNLVLCDIGDGQSISENLSTFSSHMTKVIDILGRATSESLVLLDELGSGTDPAEGMGLALAILDELCAKGCLFVVTTHYPELKKYAGSRPECVNARMAFDRQSLMPLYRLEIGEAGESCALYIAERLGMPGRILERARRAAYGNSTEKPGSAEMQTGPAVIKPEGPPQIIRQKETRSDKPPRSSLFNLGDSVIVYPGREIGIVCARDNGKGEIGVQIKKKKHLINHKRLKLHVPASELYPEDYDFSIIFDTVANRKARHILDKRHEPGNVVVLREGDKE
jgi:dsDNA-specific endonuclease/ATPase MutS2